MMDLRRATVAVVTVGGLWFLSVACGDDYDAAPAPTTCTPGASISCVGPGGCAGGQPCNAEGTAYGPCDCSGAPGPTDAGNNTSDSGTLDSSASETGSDAASCIGASTPPRIVFLNRNGGTYVPGPTDARSNKTPLVNGAQTVSPWSVTADSWKTLRDCVAEKFLPFNISFTDVDPGPEVEHMEIVFAPASLPAFAGQPAIAPLTCTVVPNAIAFVSQTVADANVTHACALTVRNVGYSLGLESVVACPDAMSFGYASCANAGFTNVSLTCGMDSPAACQCQGGTSAQDSYERMLSILGPVSVKRLLVFTAASASAFVVVVGSGCARLIGLEETTTVTNEAGLITDANNDAAVGIDDDDASATVPPDPEGDGGVLGEGDGGPTDAGPDACVIARPEAFEAVISGAVSDVCNAEGSLVQGGAFAGLDCYGAGVDTIDGLTVTACIGFDFGAASVASAKVRLFATDKGCQNKCYSDGCDNIATARLFVGKSRSITTWQNVGFAKLSSTAANYSIEAPAGDFHIVGVCRSGAGAQYEDIGVDGIAAACR